jgi:two-component system KDP operon response regulator KdpE
MDRAFPRRALICDDDPSIRRVVGGLLVAHGWEIVAEVDLATDAVRVAAISHPDLVILDVALMGMSGLEAIPALRAAQPGCVVIVFSSFDAARAEAIDAGADAVIDKADPARLDEALAVLASA